MSLVLDPTKVRAQFPAFAESTLQGKAFFENAGGSYTAIQVIDKLETYYRQTKVQPYGVYPASEIAGKAMDTAFERLAEAMNVSADWIQIGPSTSANSYVLGNALAKMLKPGDAVVVTNQDHEANSGAWRRLESVGVEVREWQVDPHTGHLDIEKLYALLDDKVKAVAFPHASNIVGEINPVKDICARAHAVGAVAIVDGVSYAPHGLPDVSDLGADIYMFSAYKVYGPHQGIFAIRPELAAKLPNQGHFFNDEKPRYRLTPAGPDHAQIAACGGVVDYLESVAQLAPASDSDSSVFSHAHNLMRQQEIALMAPLMDWIKSSNRVRLIGTDKPEKRAPTLSLLLDEPGIDAARRLSNHGVMASGGHFYAYRLLKALGVDVNHGVLRLSFVHYTAPEEINQLIKALDAEIA